MKLEGHQLVLDTNILVHLLRGRMAAEVIEREYAVGQRSPRAIISVVVKGELKSLAYWFRWGSKNHARLDEMIARLPTVDLSHPLMIGTYAEIDHASREKGVKMGKNDLWIAAATRVVEGVLLTTDKDFDHLNGSLIQVERVDPSTLRGP